MSDKVLTPADVASIKARRFAGDMPKVLDSHEVQRATITRLRGLIEGMGHEAGCASIRCGCVSDCEGCAHQSSSLRFGAPIPHRKRKQKACDCVQSQVNL